MSTQSAKESAAPKPEKPGAADPGKRPTTKSDLALRALRRKSGVSMDELCKLTDWQAHSVRGFLSRTVRKKLGHEVIRQTDAKGVTRYSINKAGSVS